MFSLGTLLNGVNGLGVDLFGDHASIGGDAARGTDAKPATAGADIGNGAAWFDVQQVHDAVDLQTLVTARVLENTQVAGVGCAGWMGRRHRRLRTKDRRAKNNEGKLSGNQPAA